MRAFGMSSTYEIEVERRRKISAAQRRQHHRYFPKGSPEYRTYVAWCSMLQRCNDVNTSDYPRYGGRGITVCPEWKDYTKFLSDLGLVPAGYSLDRIDNSKGYMPSNCRWSDWTTQCRNRRNNHVLVIGGISRTMAEWSEVTGVKSSTIRARIKYNGGVVDESILLSGRKKRRVFQFQTL